MAVNQTQSIIDKIESGLTDFTPDVAQILKNIQDLIILEDGDGYYWSSKEMGPGYEETNDWETAVVSIMLKHVELSKPMDDE